MPYLAQDDDPAFKLKVQGGHKDIKSVERYAHLNAQWSKSAAEKMRRKIYGNGTLSGIFDNPLKPKSVGITGVAG